MSKKIIQNFEGKINGVGISCPGRIDKKTGCVYNGGALTFLHNVGLRAFVEESFKLPCAVSNDGKAAALAELWLGNLKNIQNGAAITLGTGVGGGLIMNGKLIEGSHFQAGELSFLLRTPEKVDRTNTIGYTGSAVHFIETAAKKLQLEDQNDGTRVFEAINKKEHGETRCIHYHSIHAVQKTFKKIFAVFLYWISILNTLSFYYRSLLVSLLYQ